MSNVSITTLSSEFGFPFNTALEDFFDDYVVSQDVECYQLWFCPHGYGTSFDDLYKLKFGSEIIVLNIMDSIIEVQTGDHEKFAQKELIKFCSSHPDHKFIIFSSHAGLKVPLGVNNLYTDHIISLNIDSRIPHCEKQDIKNKWVMLNSEYRNHRIFCTYYLLSKTYYKNGLITFNELDGENIDRLNNFTKFVPKKIHKILKKGKNRFDLKKYNRLKIKPFNENWQTNYRLNLLDVYKNTGLEIITGTMFFEDSPFITEKEVQSIYGKNFPIYINGIGIVAEMRSFGIDTFDDIIDNSYDKVQNHFDRIMLAIDKNEKILDGSINLKELWFDNQKRFDENCKKTDSILFDKIYQKNLNEKKIKKALDYFRVSYKNLKYNTTAY